MRKTYKPLARADKESQVYKRKTLNVNDDLNIKHDEDDIENIDAYWSTAMSVIGNSTIESFENDKEPSDTLFNIDNIRQSIKNEKKQQVLKDLYRHSVDEGKLIIKESNDMVDEKKAKIRRVYTEEDNSSLVRLADPASNEIVDISNDFNINESKDINKLTNNNNEIIDISNDIDQQNIINKQNFNDGFDIDFPVIDSKSETQENSTNQIENKETKMVLKTFQTVKSSPIKKTENKSTKNTSLSEVENNTAERTRIEAHKPKKQNVSYKFEVENTVLNKKNNTVVPLLCSSTIDLATMTLDYLAYIENYKTENSFSIFMIKGKIELKINNQIKIVSKGEVSLVEKDMNCGMNCISKNGAVLLLMYAL